MEEKGGNAYNGLLSATALKVIAIIAMTLDHFGWLFVDSRTPVGVCLHFVGRLTAPLMCFFITEGYHHTSNLKRYFVRLGVFALISQAPFMFFYKTAFGVANEGSMITTLFICLLSVHVINTKKVDISFKLPILLLLMYFVQKCDWGVNAVYFTLAFELSRNKGIKNQITVYSIVCFIQLIPHLKNLVFAFDECWYSIYRLGMFLPAAALLMYNGKRGRSTSKAVKTVSKYFFYAYYPLHILILTLMRINLGKM